MKKILFTLFLLFSIATQAQFKVDILEFQGNITTTIRDAYDVPNQKIWMIYNITNSRLEYAASDDVWLPLGGIADAATTTFTPYGSIVSSTVQDAIEELVDETLKLDILNSITNDTGFGVDGTQVVADVVNSEAFISGGGLTGDTKIRVASEGAYLEGVTITEIDAIGNTALITKEKLDDAIANSNGSNITYNKVHKDDVAIADGGSAIKIITDSTYTIVASDVGKDLLFESTANSIEIDSLNGVLGENDFVTIVQRTGIPVQLKDSASVGVNDNIAPRTDGKGKAFILKQGASELYVLGAIAGAYSIPATLGPELISDYDLANNNGGGDFTFINQDANRIVTVASNTMRMQQTVASTPALLIRQTSIFTIGDTVTMEVEVTAASGANNVEITSFVTDWVVPNTVGVHTYTGELDDDKLNISSKNQTVDITFNYISAKKVL